MWASGQGLKSSTTEAPLSGLFARSRMTKLNGMSPNGQRARQLGKVEFCGDGTPARAKLDCTQTASASSRIVTSRLMVASEDGVNRTGGPMPALPRSPETVRRFTLLESGHHLTTWGRTRTSLALLRDQLLELEAMPH